MTLPDEDVPSWPYETSTADPIYLLYEIENFSKLHGKKNVGERVVSEMYIIHLTDHGALTDFESMRWQIEVYPDGHDQRNQGNVTIFLRSLNDFDIAVGCQLSVSTRQETTVTIVDGTPEISLDGTVYGTCQFRHTFGSNESLWLDSLVIDRAEILKLVEKFYDALTVELKMFFFDKPQVKHSQLNLLKDIGSLLETGENFDVTLMSSDGSEHKAHKLILMSRSKVFLQMFRNNLTNDSPADVVNIEDVDNETLKQMLQFMYTGEVDNMEGNAKNLLEAADKYLLDGLKEMCTNHLRKNVNVVNSQDLVEVETIDEPVVDYFEEMEATGKSVCCLVK